MQNLSYEERMKAMATNDLVGYIHGSTLYRDLELESQEVLRETQALQEFTNALEKITGKVKGGTPAGQLLDAATNYGNEREETGFRVGFSVAMKLCMQGLSGGIC